MVRAELWLVVVNDLGSKEGSSETWIEEEERPAPQVLEIDVKNIVETDSWIFR